MNITGEFIQLHFFAFIFFAIFWGGLFFMIGRYVFWTKAGAGIVTQTIVQPTKTVQMRDFKRGDIYKAMASRLKREGKVNCQTDAPEKTARELCKAAGIKPDDLNRAKLEGNNYLFSLKNS